MRERIKLQPTRNAQINMLSSKKEKKRKEIGLITYNNEDVLLNLWAAMCERMCVISQKKNNKMLNKP